MFKVKGQKSMSHYKVMHQQQQRYTTTKDRFSDFKHSMGCAVCIYENYITCFYIFFKFFSSYFRHSILRVLLRVRDAVCQTVFFRGYVEVEQFYAEWFTRPSVDFQRLWECCLLRITISTLHIHLMLL